MADRIIRNSGFEDGDTSFWEITNGTLEISDINPHRGVYEGKITSTVEYDTVVLINRDYIEVTPHQIINAISWLRSAVTPTWRLYIYQYDADLNVVKNAIGAYKTASGTYQENRLQFIVALEAVYIRYRLEIEAESIGEISYVDDMTLSPLSIPKASTDVIQIADMSGITSSGDTSDDPHDMRGFNEYVADLRVVSVAGTNPTLDVDIIEKDAHGRTRIAGSFAQATAVSTERIAVSIMPGRSVYADYAIGGTNPIFAFDISVSMRR